MKSIILSVLLLISFNLFSQQGVLTPNGDTAINYKPTVVTLVPPLYNADPNFDPTKPRTDSAWEGIRLSADFKVVSGALALTVPPIVKTPIPKVDLRQPQTAVRNQTSFTFRNLPTSYDDYELFKNGLLLKPMKHYTQSGNVITTPPSQTGTEYELIIRVRER